VVFVLIMMHGVVAKSGSHDVSAGVCMARCLVDRVVAYVQEQEEANLFAWMHASSMDWSLLLGCVCACWLVLSGALHVVRSGLHVGRWISG
jgi:hypothetical protein